MELGWYWNVQGSILERSVMNLGTLQEPRSARPLCVSSYKIYMQQDRQHSTSEQRACYLAEEQQFEADMFVFIDKSSKERRVSMSGYSLSKSTSELTSY